MNSEHLAVQDLAPAWGPRRPGVYIQRQLDAVGRSQSDLAERMGISKKHLNQVIKGAASVSPDFALALERAIGIRAGLLLRLEADWQTYRIENESRADLAQHVRWLANFPRETLLENRVVEPSDDELTMVDRVLRFFGVSNPPAFEHVWLAPQASFKRSEAFAINPYCTALWLQLAARKAEQLSTAAPTYNVQLLRDAATQLPSLTTNPFPEAFREAQRLLLKAGVILVFQPEVKETRLSGVSLWLPSDRPMIALTNRYKFSDSLWFSLTKSVTCFST
jgi:HTH-type transcriptional regulator/antitoxin HigA